MNKKETVSSLAQRLKDICANEEFSNHYKGVFNEKEGIAIRDSIARQLWLTRSLLKGYDERKYTMLKNRSKDFERKYGHFTDKK